MKVFFFCSQCHSLRTQATELSTKLKIYGANIYITFVINSSWTVETKPLENIEILIKLVTFSRWWKLISHFHALIALSHSFSHFQHSKQFGRLFRTMNHRELHYSGGSIQNIHFQFRLNIRNKSCFNQIHENRVIRSIEYGQCKNIRYENR